MARISKTAQKMNYHLFEKPQIVETPDQHYQSSPQQNPIAKNEIACPRCNGKVLKTVRPWDHDGHSYYCISGCMSENKTDAFYFTPEGAAPF
jgi:hypothetical protein